MIKKVVFFNFYHNGDIHVGRSFVREISKICLEKGIPCEYFFDCSPGLLNDIENVKFIRNKYNLANNQPSFVKDDILFFNTWYAGNPDIFNKYSVSFDTLYESYKINCNLIDIDLDKLDVLSLFPSIDYEKFYIKNAKQWLENHNKKRVFISNGNTASGQSINFPMFPIINTLAEKHPDIDFLISNEENGITNCDNVFLTSSIIKKDGNDLNENSYLASSCPIIVGRYSGPYTFAMTKENYFDNPKTFIAFTHMNTVWTYNFTPKPNAKIIFVPKFDELSVFRTINNNILGIK